MNYDLSSKLDSDARRSVTKANFGRGSSIPVEMMAAKYDETDMYYDENSYHNFSREILADRSADTVMADEDEGPPSSYAGSRVMRARRNGVEPYMPELSYQDIGARPEDNGIDSATARIADQARFRNRYQVFRPDGTPNIPTGEMQTSELRRAHDQTNRRFARQTGENYGTATEATPASIRIGGEDYAAIRRGVKSDWDLDESNIVDRGVSEDVTGVRRMVATYGSLSSHFGRSGKTADMILGDAEVARLARAAPASANSGIWNRADGSDFTDISGESGTAQCRSAALLSYQLTTARLAVSETDADGIVGKMVHRVAPQLSRPTQELADGERMFDPTSERISTRAAGTAHRGGAVDRLPAEQEVVFEPGRVNRAARAAKRAQSALLGRLNTAVESGEFQTNGSPSRVGKSGVLPSAIPLPAVSDEYALEDFAVRKLGRNAPLPGQNLRPEFDDLSEGNGVASIRQNAKRREEGARVVRAGEGLDRDQLGPETGTRTVLSARRKQGQVHTSHMTSHGLEDARELTR